MASSKLDQLSLTKDCALQAFENTSTSVAASQMRNALNNLADGVKDPKEKQASRTFITDPTSPSY